MYFLFLSLYQELYLESQQVEEMQQAMPSGTYWAHTAQVQIHHAENSPSAAILHP